MFRLAFQLDLASGAPALQLVDDAAYQDLGGRGAGGDAYALDAFEPALLQVFGAVDEIGRGAQAFGEFAQAVGVGVVGLPTTSTTSLSSARVFTASWRLVVA